MWTYSIPIMRAMVHWLCDAVKLRAAVPNRGKFRSSGFCFLKCNEVLSCCAHICSLFIVWWCSTLDCLLSCRSFTHSTLEFVQSTNTLIMKLCYRPMELMQNIYKAATAGILPPWPCALMLVKAIQVSEKNISNGLNSSSGSCIAPKRLLRLNVSLLC